MRKVLLIGNYKDNKVGDIIELEDDEASLAVNTGYAREIPKNTTGTLEDPSIARATSTPAPAPTPAPKKVDDEDDKKKHAHNVSSNHPKK
jgi:hypothetical protein